MTNTRPITDYNCLTFDCFATLVDWEKGIWEQLAPLRRQIPESDPRHHDKPAFLKSFIKNEDHQQAANPRDTYADVLAATYGGIAAEFGLTASDEEKKAFGVGVGDWPAFPDTLEALHRLHKHYKLVILSNVDRETFNLTVKNQFPGLTFDAIYTSQEIGSYKPDLNNFHYMIDHLDKDLGVKKDKIIHTAQSLFHDHVPATKVGLAGSYITRSGSSIGGNADEFAGQVNYSWEFTTMGDMADYVDAELAQKQA